MINKTKESRRIEYPDQESHQAYVVMPAEWLGEHAIRREEVMLHAEKFKQVELLNAAIALAVVDDFGGFPGFESNDPREWEPAKCPITLLTWLSQVVVADLAAAYQVPKNF